LKKKFLIRNQKKRTKKKNQRKIKNSDLRGKLVLDIFVCRDRFSAVSSVSITYNQKWKEIDSAESLKADN